VHNHNQENSTNTRQILPDLDNLYVTLPYSEKISPADEEVNGSAIDHRIDLSALSSSGTDTLQLPITFSICNIAVSSELTIKLRIKCESATMKWRSPLMSLPDTPLMSELHPVSTLINLIRNFWQSLL